MNTNSELERIVKTWLEARVADPPHDSLELALTRVDQTPQQHHRWLPWRFGRGRGATGSVVAPGRDTPLNDRRNRTMFSATAAATVAALALLAVLVPPQLSEVAPPPAIEASAIRVAGDGSGDFTTISEALAAAQDGDTILVAPGRYPESLIIDKDVTLRADLTDPEGSGLRQMVLLMPEDAPGPVPPLEPFDTRADTFRLPERIPVGVQIIDADATVSDMTVIGHGDGIAMLVHGGAPTLERVSLHHLDTPTLALKLAGGLFIEGGSSASVSDVDAWYRTRIAGGATPTISDSDFLFAQIVIQGGAAPVIAESSVTGESCGCVDTKVVGGSTATFSDNRFYGSGLDVGGHEGDGTSVIVERNRFSSAEGEGLAVTDGATATVNGNTFAYNRQGIRVDSATAEIRDNEFVGNWAGAMLNDTDSTLADNTLRGGTHGITVSSSGSPVIRGNRLEKNTFQGLYAAKGTSPIVEGNRICGSEVNLKIDPEARPVLGDNDICTDGEVAAAG